MTNAELWLGSLLLGVATSYVWVWRFAAVERRLALKAAAWDVITLVLTYAPLQVWAVMGADWRVLAAYIIGNGIGTWLVVRKEPSA